VLREVAVNDVSGADQAKTVQQYTSTKGKLLTSNNVTRWSVIVDGF
jgi:hypothetical protein